MNQSIYLSIYSFRLSLSVSLSLPVPVPAHPSIHPSGYILKVQYVFGEKKSNHQHYIVLLLLLLFFLLSSLLLLLSLSILASASTSVDQIAPKSMACQCQFYIIRSGTPKPNEVPKPALTHAACTDVVRE